jgi:HAD superfamily phosphatase (TIGR01668 family)
LKIFTPHLQCARLSDLDPDSLLARGYKGFMTDIDNTITAHDSLRIPDENHKWIARCKDAGIPIVLITYNFEGRFIKTIAKILDCPLIKVRFPYIHRNTVKCAADIMGIEPHEVVGVNDFRIALTVLRLFGCQQTVLVDPICMESERPSTILRHLRWIENRIIVPLTQRKP